MGKYAERVYQSGKTRRRNANKARNLKRDKEMLKSQTLPAPDDLKRAKQMFNSQTLPAPDKTPQQEPLPDADMTLPQSQGTNPECTIQCIRIQDNIVSYAGQCFQWHSMYYGLNNQ